ncbi:MULTISPECIES: hypothetical protein [unclassified Streptomyces]|uniref:hypothetical protein n=1 Tax=unclassified Streptomyces TaxID=2593676 RepID=UPI002E82373A|nr:hypothetical protein [Streptomyces sp. NBC_00589]WTI34443.1 hypothetical protein OIC96_05265 [Streptomyces sp. NBC_00775]WUB31885.1 hypothetical protein OHA51_44465 [Streptomyces sp. NBC_00589]
MAIGLGALTAGFALLALWPEPTGYGVIAVVLTSLGLGDGLAITTSAAVLVSAVPAERAGQAGAVSETSYELGVGPGVALLGSIHAAVYHARLGPLPLEGEQLRTARESAGGAHDVAQDIGGAQGAAVLRAASDAFDSALTTTAYVSAALVAVAAVLTVALVPKDFKVTGTH